MMEMCVRISRHPKAVKTFRREVKLIPRRIRPPHDEYGFESQINSANNIVKTSLHRYAKTTNGLSKRSCSKT